MRSLKIVVGALATVTLSLLAPEAAASTLTVCGGGCMFTTIQAAINAAVNGDTISVGAGTYAENVVVDKQVSIQGAGAGSTVVVPASSNPACSGGSLCGGAASSVFLVRADNVSISALTVDGNNPGISSGVTSGGVDVDARNGIITDHLAGVFDNLSVSGVTVQNVYLRAIYASSGGTFSFSSNTVTNVRGDASSIAIFNFGGAGTISGNTVSNANDAIACNESTGVTITNNTVTNAGSGVHTDNAGELGGPADQISGNNVSACDTNGYGVWVFAPHIAPTVTGNQVSGCSVGVAAFGQGVPGTTPSFTANVLDGAGAGVGSAGIFVTTDMLGFGDGNVSASFSQNRVEGFDTGVVAEERNGASTSASLSFNLIVGNTTGASGALAGSVNAQNNWWGCSAGPGGAGCDAVTGSFTSNPWLVNRLTASPDPVSEGGQATLTSDLTFNSGMVEPGGTLLAGIPVAFSSSPVGTTFMPATGSLSAGVATATFAASSTVQVCAKVPSTSTTAAVECFQPNVSGIAPTDACPGPTPVALTAGSTIMTTGTTVGFTDDFTSFCGDKTSAMDAPDVVYAFTLDQQGSFKVNVAPTSGSSLFPAIYLQTTCGSDFYCADFSAVNDELWLDLPAGTYYVVVDGAGGTSGGYQMTVSFDVAQCGDGVLNPGEQCDAGGVSSTDGCGDPGAGNACQLEAPVAGTDQCQGNPVSVPAGTTILTGLTTNGYTNDYSSPTCGFPPGGADYVFQLTPAITGTLTASVGYAADGVTDTCVASPFGAFCWDHVIYARSTCTDGTLAGELACADSGIVSVETISFPVVMGVPVWVIVDGYDDQYYSQGPFNLKVVLQ